VAEKHWWNEFQMDSKLGPDQAKHWRDSGLIIHKPDPVKGSTEPAHIMWGVPKLWESMTESDWKALKLETQRDGKEGDEAAVAELTMISKSSLGDDPMAGGSAEGKTPKEIQNAFYEEIKTQPAINFPQKVHGSQDRLHRATIEN
jgi:hypothetical protein